MTGAPGSTDRTRIRRLPERAVHEREALYGILDAGLVAHVAVLDADGQPYVVPVAYARMNDSVLFHGSTGSRLFRLLEGGQPTCLTVTHLDGLVVARSAFESSMNYRSAMILGVARRLTGSAALQALEVITDHLTPGRWAECRQPTKREIAATMVLSLSLDEASVKVRTGGPEDLPEDLVSHNDLWAGEVPILTRFGPPVTDDTCPATTAVPEYILRW